MKYKFFPHTADVMFEAYGRTLEKVFENSALAVESIMVNIDTLNINENYEIALESDNIESLLYDFLSELIFVKDTEGFLFKKFDVRIHNNKNKKIELISICEGEKINTEKHELMADAKAVTMHEFSLKKKKDIWVSKVIVDI